MAGRKAKTSRIAKSVYFNERQIKNIEAMAKKYNLSFSAVVCDAVDAQMRKSKGEGDDVQSQLNTN